jgi:tight adherence protein B
MVADEFEDPIGPEFAHDLDEINFGVASDLALLNLTPPGGLPGPQVLRGLG